MKIVKGKAIGIIQARCSSSRLPGKVLLPLAGIPMIHHIYDRALSCELLSDVIVATSNEETDKPLVKYCQKNMIPVFMGSLNNVLSRYVQILNNTNAEYFVRITGDCPLIHPNFIDFQIHTLRANDADFIRLTPNMSLLDGQGVMSARSLFCIARKSDSDDDKEHVGSIYIGNNLSMFNIIKVKVLSEYYNIDMSLSVDEISDYDFISCLYEKFYNGGILDLTLIADYLTNEKLLVAERKNRNQSEINQKLEKKKLFEKDILGKKVEWIWV